MDDWGREKGRRLEDCSYECLICFELGVKMEKIYCVGV